MISLEENSMHVSDSDSVAGSGDGAVLDSIDDSSIDSLDDSAIDSNDDSKINPVDEKTVEKSNNTKSSDKGSEVKTPTEKTTTKISVNKVNAYYKEKSNLNIYLKDSNNKAIRNRVIKIYLNGKTYSRFTDALGKITLKLNLKPNRYNVKIVFEGDNNYKSSSINTVVNVKKAPLTIKTTDTVSYFHPDTFFKAKVINKITKKPVEGIRVLFNVYSSQTKYKNYYAFTNKNGIAILNKHLKTGFYDVYTYIKDNAKKPFISYRNSENKAKLRVMDTREIGCSSIYVHANENESAIAFRRDSTYAANLYIVAVKWHGRYAVKQYKTTGTYFFHAIATSDGWLIGTGGWDNPTVNKKIENLAGKIVSSNSLNSTLLKSIKAQERKLNTGHLAIVAPDGRYAVIWKNSMLKGKLKNGEYLDVPNVRSLFRRGKYKKFSSNAEKAALKIAATDVFGVNRRNIMVYHYKRTSKNFEAKSYVNIYGSNDKGNLAGRHTSGKKDNVYFKKKFISKYKLSGTPNQKFIGKIVFGNIDKLIKTQTKMGAPIYYSNYSLSDYFKVTLKNKKTNKALKFVKINLKIFTGETHKNYVVKTDKNGIAKFNTKNIAVGNHIVMISPANHDYIISGKTRIVIRKLNIPMDNTTTA